MATSISDISPTHAPATAASRTLTSRLEVGAILLMTAGFGYINGNFYQPLDTGYGPLVDLAHALPLAALLWIGVELLRTVDEGGAAHSRRHGLRLGVTIVAILAALISIVMIVLGAFAPALGVGVQEFSDWLAVILAGGGAVLWFASLLPIARR